MCAQRIWGVGVVLYCYMADISNLQATDVYFCELLIYKRDWFVIVWDVVWRFAFGIWSRFMAKYLYNRDILGRKVIEHIYFSTLWWHERRYIL